MLSIDQPTLIEPNVRGISRRLLWDIACWSLSEGEVEELFPNYSQARLNQLRQKLNRDVVRVVMLVLSLDAFEGSATAFSIRKLARALDRPREESMQRTLRNWLLPLLTDAQWIEGFVLTDDWSSSPHEITITQKGLRAVDNYFYRVKRVTGNAS